jgi:hypothetical protein
MAETSLHDSVAAAFEQHATEAPAPATPADPSPAALPPDTPDPFPGEIAEPKEPSADKAAGESAGSQDEPPKGRQRGPDGRYLPKEQQQTVAPDAVAPASPTPAPADSAKAPEHAEAPQSWPVEKRGDWAKVPAEVRGYLHQRENELQKGFQQVAQRGNVADAVLNEFAPYSETLAKEGATPVQAIRTLLQTVHALRTGGAEYRKAVLMSLADQYDVDMSSQIDPNLAKAEAQASMLMTEKMYGSAAQQERERVQVHSELSAFANDPKNEFFPKVRQLMGELVGKGAATDIQTAYDMAVKLHPETSVELQNRAFAAREAAARKAAVASMSVGGAPNGAAAPNPEAPMSLRDTIASQMSNLTP